MYAHYQKLAQDNMTQYPVAQPLIRSGMIDAGGYKVKMNDVFSDDFANALPELFDSKEHDTDQRRPAPSPSSILPKMKWYLCRTCITWKPICSPTATSNITSIIVTASTRPQALHLSS